MPSFSFEFFEPVPITQSPTLAVLLIVGLQIVSVQSPQNGFGAAPPSCFIIYEYSLVILIVTEHGYGKTTPAKEYKIQKRGGSGIKTAKVTTKTGPIVCGIVLKEEERTEGELVIMSQKGQVIKLPLKDVPSLGRQTQGVRVMKMREGDAIASVVFV